MEYKYEFRNPNHNPTTVDSIKSNNPPDYDLKVNEAVFQIHSEIMALVSDYFDKALTFRSMQNGFNEQSIKSGFCVQLDDMDENAVIAVIDYAYNGYITIAPETVLDLLQCADFLIMQSLIDGCNKYLAKGIDCENFLQKLELFKSMGNEYLVNEIVFFIAKYFYHFRDSRIFLTFDNDLLRKVLQCDKLIVMESVINDKVCDANTSSLKKKNDFMFVNPGRQEEILVDCVLEYLQQERNVDNAGLLYQFLSKAVRMHLISQAILKSFYLVKKISESENCRTLLECLCLQLDSMTWIKKPRDLSDVMEIKWFNPLAFNVFPDLRDRRDFDDSDLATENCPVVYVTGMTIYQRSWYEHQIVGAITIRYSNGKISKYGDARFSIGHTFDLNPNERIVKITARSGWMVDCLSFHTNTGRKFGDYGGDGGGLVEIDRPGSSAYLAFLKGSVTRCIEGSSIRNLQFGWVYCNHFINRTN